MKVLFSPVGPGFTTGALRPGHPTVNNIEVDWLVTEGWVVWSDTDAFRNGDWELLFSDQNVLAKPGEVIFRSFVEATQVLLYLALHGVMLPKSITFDTIGNAHLETERFLFWLTISDKEKPLIRPDVKFTILNPQALGSGTIEESVKCSIDVLKGNLT